jgi:hypothetical protein
MSVAGFNPALVKFAIALGWGVLLGEGCIPTDLDTLYQEWHGSCQEIIASYGQPAPIPG